MLKDGGIVIYNESENSLTIDWRKSSFTTTDGNLQSIYSGDFYTTDESDLIWTKYASITDSYISIEALRDIFLRKEFIFRIDFYEKINNYIDDPNLFVFIKSYKNSPDIWWNIIFDFKKKKALVILGDFFNFLQNLKVRVYIDGNILRTRISYNYNNSVVFPLEDINIKNIKFDKKDLNKLFKKFGVSFNCNIKNKDEYWKLSKREFNKIMRKIREQNKLILGDYISQCSLVGPTLSMHIWVEKEWENLIDYLYYYILKDRFKKMFPKLFKIPEEEFIKIFFTISEF